VKDVQAKTILIEGSAGAGIVSEIEQDQPLMVVIGTRGLGGIRRMVLGSVAAYVVANSPSNVFVAKD
jgi:nucleotide-binding universal stress UspA family protein